MSIKPDHWIRKMALEHRMIEPFVDRPGAGRRDLVWPEQLWLRYSGSQ